MTERPAMNHAKLGKDPAPPSRFPAKVSSDCFAITAKQNRGSPRHPCFQSFTDFYPLLYLLHRRGDPAGCPF